MSETDDKTAQITQPPPSINEVAEQVVGAMVSVEPVPPVGWASIKDDDGKTVTLVAVVMGRENASKFEALLEKLKPNMSRVDIFDGTDGEPNT